MTTGYWIVSEVRGTTAQFAPMYPFFVMGQFREVGRYGDKTFAWHVPAIYGESYDFSQCSFIDNAALKSLGL